MIEWNEQRVIDADIETVWNLFKDEEIRRIMPKLEKHVLVEKRQNEVGAKHEQTYREGKRLETYIVETLAYEDAGDRKHKRLHFVLAKMFDVHLSFTLLKLSEGQTRFIYRGSNEGINFIGKSMLKMAGPKSNQATVGEFMDLVEKEAMIDPSGR